VNAGKLDRLIILQRRSFIPNEFGEKIETWNDLATVSAQRVEMRGSERHTSAQTVAQFDTKFRIRYKRTLGPVDRIISGGRAYDIGPPLEIGRGEGLEFHGKARAE
jgi:SPP1 family predicted phage head-tail adaptor